MLFLFSFSYFTTCIIMALPDMMSCSSMSYIQFHSVRIVRLPHEEVNFSQGSPFVKLHTIIFFIPLGKIPQAFFNSGFGLKVKIPFQFCRIGVGLVHVARLHGQVFFFCRLA